MNFTTDYQTVKAEKIFSFRGFARDLALNGLSFANQMQKLQNLRSKPRVQFLYLHHVFEDECEKFEKLLKGLSKNFTFISHSEAVEKILNNNIDKPYLSISSDDGFKNNIQAAKILDRYSIKACFFINPDTIGLNNFQQVKSFCRKRLNFPPTQFMNWNDIEDLMKEGHEIGSHTMEHINVAENNLSEIEDNLQTSFNIIKSRCGKADHFAYPYGRYFHFNLPAFNLVFEIGYKSCSSAERGCHITDSPISRDELFIRRDHIICDWQLGHIDYFLLKNSKKANKQNNFVPYPDI